MEYFVARQPIFDKQLNVYAYELLFRSGFQNVYKFEDGDKIAEKLFSKDPELQMNLYEIRSQIAHGHISESDFEKIEPYRYKLLDARRISQQIILSSIYNAEKIINKIII